MWQINVLICPISKRTTTVVCQKYIPEYERANVSKLIAFIDSSEQRH